MDNLEEALRKLNRHIETSTPRELIRGLCQATLEAYREGFYWNESGEQQTLRTNEEKEDWREEFLVNWGIDILEYEKDPERTLNKYLNNTR